MNEYMLARLQSAMGLRLDIARRDREWSFRSGRRNSSGVGKHTLDIDRPSKRVLRRVLGKRTAGPNVGHGAAQASPMRLLQASRRRQNAIVAM
jgi:hypothetical protein